MPGTVLGAGDAAGNKIIQSSALVDFIFYWVETDNKLHKYIMKNTLASDNC